MAVIGANDDPDIQLNHSIRSADEPVTSTGKHYTFDFRTIKSATLDVDNMSVALWRGSYVYHASPIDINDYVTQELSF
jgi:hypothetical protein